MFKKIARFICILELIIAVVMYFAIAYQFDNDRIIMKILPHTDFEATLLRLSIYIVPGINIIAGVFGITFCTKGILIFAGVLEILNGILTLYYKGASDLMNTMGIMMIVIGIIFIICIIFAKDLKNDIKKRDL
ncbi:MAG: hypothetical protein K6A70_09365 [Erysipelotrichaceae bacterium]|nr:hypothetical protein [Erysipelotrichaceae bacterium]